MDVLPNTDATVREGLEQLADGRGSTGVIASSFQVAFGPLAHHFFPDGCPVVVDGIETVQPEESAYLQQVWPVSERRVAVSATIAIQSITDLREYAVATGLTAAELVAVAVIATATLPSGPSTVHSPLRDGNTVHFCSLVRCLLPKCSEDTPQQQSVDGNAVRVLTDRLLSVLRWGKAIPTTGQHDHKEAVSKAKCCVLRFLTLVLLRWGTNAVHYFSKLHTNVIFQSVLQPETTVDAVRFLLHLTIALPPFRLAQLKAYSDHMQQLPKKNLVAIDAVKALLERQGVLVHTIAGKHETNRLANESRTWVDFPEELWEREFVGEYNTSEMAGNAHSIRCSSGDGRLAKRPRRSRANLLRLSAFLQKRLQTVSSTNDSPLVMTQKLWNVTSTASDVLEDAHRRHLLSLSSEEVWLNEDANATIMVREMDLEAHRFRGVLPYKLHEQWFQQEQGHRMDVDVDDGGDTNTGTDTLERTNVLPQSTRQRLICSLAELALKEDCLPVEAQVFITEHILPTWDGDCGCEMGRLLLYNVLPYMHPLLVSDSLRNSSDVISLSSREFANGMLLHHLERFFLYGSKRLQYAIVSGTLAALVHRWGRIDWSALLIKNKNKAREKKNQVLTELVQWTDDLLLKGFLASDTGDELIRAAAVDFYLSVCDLANAQDHDHSTNDDVFAVVTAPSPSLTYRLLLSPSALHIDRVCGLLVRYKEIFQKWKQDQTQLQETDSTNANQTLGMKRVKVFNCFVWDFCSVLWRCSPLPPPQSSKSRKNTDESARTLSILYTDLRPETQEILHESAPASALSITHGAVFAGYVSDFLEHCREQVRDSDQLFTSADQIQGRLKIQYLDYLKARGLHGIHEFLLTFVATLAEGRHME